MVEDKSNAVKQAESDFQETAKTQEDGLHQTYEDFRKKGVTYVALLAENQKKTENEVRKFHNQLAKVDRARVVHVGR